jgi:hypothetical protein
MGPAGKWGWLLPGAAILRPHDGPLGWRESPRGADFNGYGKGDLVLQGNPSFLDTAEIYWGKGDGTFS